MIALNTRSFPSAAFCCRRFSTHASGDHRAWAPRNVVHKSMRASLQCAAPLLVLLALCCRAAAGDAAAGAPEQPGAGARGAVAALQQQGLLGAPGSISSSLAARSGGVSAQQTALSLVGKCITATVSVAGPAGPTSARFVGPASQTPQTAFLFWQTETFGCDHVNPLGLLFIGAVQSGAAGSTVSSGISRNGQCAVGMTTFTWTSAWFRGCTLVPQRSNYPPLQTPTIAGPDASGTITVTVPPFTTDDSATSGGGEQSFVLINCPATPPPAPGGCNGLNDGTSCKWLPPDRHAWASPYMADASVGRLQRVSTRSSASTAATLMAAGPASAGECLGRCTCGTCTISPEAATCCTSAAHAPSRKHASYGDDQWYGHGGYGGGGRYGAYVQKTAAAEAAAAASGAADATTATAATTTAARVQRADYGGNGYGSDSADDGSSWTCWKYQQGPY